MKWRTLMCLMLCGLMLSGCVIALGTGRSSCPRGKQHEQFEELEMREGGFAEHPGMPVEELEHRMRGLDERAEQLQRRAEELEMLERELAEHAEELERRARELEEESR